MLAAGVERAASECRRRRAKGGGERGRGAASPDTIDHSGAPCRRGLRPRRIVDASKDARTTAQVRDFDRAALSFSPLSDRRIPRSRHSGRLTSLSCSPKGGRSSRTKGLSPMFRKLALGLALAGSLAFPLASSAEAAVADGVVAEHNPADQIAPVEKAQYVWGGQNYCWYGAGWQGPGWYWCGYAWRTGLGWGGAYGWHGWRGGYALARSTASTAAASIVAATAGTAAASTAAVALYRGGYRGLSWRLPRRLPSRAQLSPVSVLGRRAPHSRRPAPGAPPIP